MGVLKGLCVGAGADPAKPAAGKAGAEGNIPCAAPGMCPGECFSEAAFNVF